MPPQSENVYKLKRNDQQQKHQALCLGWRHRDHTAGRLGEETVPFSHQPLKFPFGECSGTILKQVFLINGRKSINPTILSIQFKK